MSVGWLLDRLEDGFDIHHMDGEHSNDHPDNLVLIYHPDHMLLHRGGRPKKAFLGRLKKIADPEATKDRRLQLGKPIYRAREKSEAPYWTLWANVSGENVDETNDRDKALAAGKARLCAETFAAEHGLRWPIPPSGDVAESRRVAKERRLRIGKKAYPLRQEGLKWLSIAHKIDPAAFGLQKRPSESFLSMCARQHAEDNGLPWPIQIPQGSEAHAATLRRHNRGQK